MDRNNPALQFPHSDAHVYPPLNQHYSSPSQEPAPYPYPYASQQQPHLNGQPPHEYLHATPYMTNLPAHSLQPHSSPQLSDSCQLVPPHFRHEESAQCTPSEADSHPPSESTSYGNDPQLLLPDNIQSDDSNKTSQAAAYPPPVDNHITDLCLSDKPGSAPSSPMAALASAPESSSVPLGKPFHQPSASYSGAFDGREDYSGYTDAVAWDANYSNSSSPEVCPYFRCSASLNNSDHTLKHSSHFRYTRSMRIVPSSKQRRSHSLQLAPISRLKAPLQVLLLHGNLDIWIYDAKHLPNMDKFHKMVGDVFKFPGHGCTRVEERMIHKPKITSDPYVSISIAGAVIGRTYVLSNDENPVWMQHFNVPVAHSAAEIYFTVKDSDVVGSQLIGVVAIPVQKIFSGVLVKGTYPILNSSGRSCKAGAVLSLSIQYMPMEKLNVYHFGVGAGPHYQGVPGTYFPLRKGGSVTLYQDAHVPDGHLPNPWLHSGVPYVHGKCWKDIFEAIRDAQRLVYITGWSVWHKVRLIRDGGSASEYYSLGELLSSKSREGVRVLLLIWDDPTSRSILGYKTDGIMQTHDEETRRFFKHSSVQVLLCPRVAGKRHSWVKQREVETIYTHHQKTVIVDADAGNNMRKIVAFLGGLDLCDGRYDNPQHPLFKTLDTVHEDDYHNPSFAGRTDGCPREPWHDLHCKIDGPAAYDVLTNFEERWTKAAKPRGIKKLKKSFDDALLRIEKINDIFGAYDAPCHGKDDPEAWHVQIFRSIDSNSVKSFPKNPKEATLKNLVCGKNVLIDMSIHSAYVKAIRSAQHYIYIENQYFIGSSFNWKQHKDIGANNLIPMEIALKIADKIRVHQRFAVYIVIPMWPEGIPTGAATQRILYWQNKTMQMMYETIFKALVEVGLEDSYTPQDYLNFFCLGSREGFDETLDSCTEIPSGPNIPQVQCQRNRRFMIYVHSKGMIVDDEYVILGSANINQRSMEGTRDTEIAMGGYQPYYTWAKLSAQPRGQIYGYRMSLWAEHLGGLEDVYNEPESIECVRRVRAQAEMNWAQFASDEVTEMKGHLLKYPVAVDRRGRVKPLKGHEQFPDVNGHICGSFLAIQENLTI